MLTERQADQAWVEAGRARNERAANSPRPGDTCTIAGVRQRPDGSYTSRCKPGNETRFVVSGFPAGRKTEFQFVATYGPRPMPQPEWLGRLGHG